MIRHIYCEECDRRISARPQHPEDVAAGWKSRRVQIQAKKPEKHEVRIFAGDSMETLQPVKTITLVTLHCDACNCPLPDGSPAFAITDWQESCEGEPGPWEQEFTR